MSQKTQFLKQLAKGRLVPITKSEEDGNTYIVAYRRRPGSRKSGQEFWLKKPVLVKPKQTPEQTER